MQHPEPVRARINLGRTTHIAASAVALTSAPLNIAASSAPANTAQPAKARSVVPVMRSMDVTETPKPAQSARATPRRGSRTKKAAVTAAPHGATPTHRSS